jgi:dienelactone hydrolase
MVETKLQEAGRPVRLEVIVFKPSSAGQHPLAIINHGSTGPCGRMIPPTRVWAPIDLASYFVGKGYAVAYPQRRGRGASGGRYDEGFGPDRPGCYSCLKPQSLSGFDRAVGDVRAAIEALAQDPELDTSKILMVGVSRGGAVAVAYAGLFPQSVIGVVNFVGGWHGVACSTYLDINSNVLIRGAKYPRPMLWLYGAEDPTYSPSHVRELHRRFSAAGGKAQLEVLPGDHFIFASRSVWLSLADQYLAGLRPQSSGAPAGTAIDHTYVGSDRDCGRVCAGDARCGTYRYDGPSKRCELLGTARGSPAAAARPPTVGDRPGNYTYVNTQGDCEFVCRQNAGCHRYRFDVPTKRCFYELR